MIEDIVGSNGSRFIIAIGGVALALLGLVVVLWFIRNRPSSPFIRGGKNRQPRLAVLDAAAVDTRRRLVLVRRDDVEHLIMIGGPTDIVIESRISSAAAVAQPVTEVPVSAAKPVTERRPVQQPQPEQKPQPVVGNPTPQVSGMGNVLYGENFEASSPATRSTQPPVQRPRVEPSAARPPQQAASNSSAPSLPRPSSASSAAPALSVQHARTPEDILDAARNRVLSSTASAAPAPAAVITNVPQEQKTPAADFERILDAEISGDLGRLNIGSDTRIDSNLSAQATGERRQEPRFAGGQQRNEPTLEEEMNRMLGEMSAADKR